MKSLPQEFDEYRLLVIPAGATQSQVRECRRAFYAGAGAVLTLLHALSGNDVSEDDGVAALGAMRRDLEAFCEAVRTDKA